jgi:ATP/maltotriose-dependent transcriptional regulator MalT
MKNLDLQAELARLAAEISALAAECDLPLQDARIVRDYLDHDEPGMALEHLCDTLIDAEAPVTEGQCRRILDAAKALGMVAREPQEWKLRMETLVSRVP